MIKISEEIGMKYLDSHKLEMPTFSKRFWKDLQAKGYEHFKG